MTGEAETQRKTMQQTERQKYIERKHKCERQREETGKGQGEKEKEAVGKKGRDGVLDMAKNNAHLRSLEC